jgi:glycopeptide antibiotics resistance protein
MLQFNDGLFFAILIVVWGGFRISRIIFFGKTLISREVIVNLLFLYLCYVIYVTSFPMTYIFYSFNRTVNLIPLVKSISMIQNAITLGVMVRDVVINLLGNLLLLVPLGFFLPVLSEKSRSAFKIIGLGFVVSLSIEMSQFILAVRIFDVDDILLNTLGALLGYSIFKLILKIPAAATQIKNISHSDRKDRNKGILAFALVALLAFLAIFFTQLVAKTKTIVAYSNEITSDSQQLIGKTGSEGFVSLFSQTLTGEKSVKTYFKVFLDRYELFSTQNDLQKLETETYTVSGASKGSVMVYFVIARSNQDIYQMVYHDQRFPVTTFGDYHFSYAAEPLTQGDDYVAFDFVDRQGTKLTLSKEK